MASRCFFFLPLALLVACTAVEIGSSSEDTSNLIGGREAGASELPATMLIKGNCTVAKVGPRHILTAAHCVTGNNTAKFADGKTISVTAVKAVGAFAAPPEPDAAATPFRDVTIEKTEVQPAWRDHCASAPCINVNISGRTDIADVALIITREELTGIPEVPVDLAPLAVGDRVAITGYGCEGEVGGSWNYANQRLRVAETTIIPFDSVIHPGSFIHPQDRDSGLVAMMSGHYAVTPGPTDPNAIDAGNQPGRGGLCPGDSGGPLYRLDTPTPVVVGVNANYTFITGRTIEAEAGAFNYGGSPVTNWHTRLDTKSGHDIGGWLRGLGATTVCTRGTCE